MYQPAPSMNASNARTVFAEGLRIIKDGQLHFDLAKLIDVDSTAVAILVAWQRAARRAGKTLQIQNVPLKLQSLMDLYGVSDLLQDKQVAESTEKLPQH